LLDDPLETFGFAYNVSNGGGSRALIRAAYYSRDLGATQDYIVNLMHQINKYWVIPMPEDKLEKTIISQINRWF
jgi:hypothetical protein